MYGPAPFLDTDADAIAGLLAAHPLAVLCAAGPDGPVVAHAPLLAERDAAGAIIGLVGHVAGANPFVTIPQGARVTAVFVGPDAYVSPSAYASKREHGRVVPTWNYVRAEVEGRVSFTRDQAALEALVAALTDHHEAERPHPWRLSDAPRPYVDALLGAIVGVRVDVTGAAGKWKLSQNRAASDARGVMADLAAHSNPSARAVGQAMAARTVSNEPA